MSKRLKVVAGLIFNTNKQVLITQRHSGRWEFPGGKLEQGETLEQCLVRELEEELHIKATVGSLFSVVQHRYPDCCVELTTYNVDSYEGQPQQVVHRSIKWVLLSQLGDYDFLEADLPIIQQLMGVEKGPR